MSTDIYIDEVSESVVFKTTPSDPVPAPGQTKVISKVFGESVKNTDTLLVDYTLLDGKQVTISKAAGTLFAPATPSADFRSELVIDPGGSEILIDVFRGFDVNHSIEETYVASGANRTIRLRIHNETSADAIVSMRWIGFVEDAP